MTNYELSKVYDYIAWHFDEDTAELLMRTLSSPTVRDTCAFVSNVLETIESL